MRQKMIGTVVLATLALQVPAWQSAAGAPQSASDLVGTWKLVSSVTERVETELSSLGLAPKGC